MNSIRNGDHAGHPDAQPPQLRFTRNIIGCGVTLAYGL
jgi:hypothetical protein